MIITYICKLPSCRLSLFFTYTYTYIPINSLRVILLEIVWFQIAFKFVVILFYLFYWLTVCWMFQVWSALNFSTKFKGAKHGQLIKNKVLTYNNVICLIIILLKKSILCSLYRTVHWFHAACLPSVIMYNVYALKC